MITGRGKISSDLLSYPCILLTSDLMASNLKRNLYIIAKRWPFIKQARLPQAVLNLPTIWQPEVAFIIYLKFEVVRTIYLAFLAMKASKPRLISEGVYFLFTTKKKKKGLKHWCTSNWNRIPFLRRTSEFCHFQTMTKCAPNSSSLTKFKKKKNR